MLQILHIEDNFDDAELIGRTIRRSGIEANITLIQTAQELSRCLSEKTYDLIISDFSLQAFHGAAALEIVRQKSPDTPFLFLSGTIREDTAVQALHEGATDYVLKQNLRRLIPAITRAMRQTDEARERQQLEEQLKHSQKMELVGRLASGVAHDFNNVLTIIEGYTDLISENLKDDSIHKEFITEIVNAVQRGASLTGQLLAFSKKQVSNPKVLDLNHIISQTEKMLARLIGEEMTIIATLSETPLYIVANENEIEQILMNLAVNARDAMPRGGVLKVTTTLEPAVSEKSAGSVLLKISDTGSGMDAPLIARIFEPFFTTKQSGTGLGLAMVEKIVKESNGQIRVESVPEKGTTFHISWPEAPGQAAKRTTTEISGLPRGRGERILVVEDEPHLRALFATVFDRAGYKPIIARDGEEAKLICKDEGNNIDIIVTDIVTSKTNGPELVNYVSRLWPQIRILFMSGHTAEIFERYQIDSAGMNFIQKPFSNAELLTKVWELLESEPNDVEGITHGKL